MTFRRTLASAVTASALVAGLSTTACALPVLDAYVVTYLANDSPYEIHGAYGDYANGTPYEYRPFAARGGLVYSRSRSVTTTVTTSVYGIPLRHRWYRHARWHESRRFAPYRGAWSY